METESKICDFGWNAVNFKLKSIDDNFYTLDDLRGKNATLAMFICNHCPYVKSMIEKIKFETDELKKLGVNSFAIMSNDQAEYPEDSFENMKVFFNKYNLNIPYLLDESQEIAKKYNAQCTPDFFGFNNKLELQYRGRLDSSGKNNNPQNLERELFNAMKQVSISGNGPTKQIPSIGCSIKWKK